MVFTCHSVGKTCFSIFMQNSVKPALHYQINLTQLIWLDFWIRHSSDLLSVSDLPDRLYIIDCAYTLSDKSDEVII